jgi:outer membrane protein assembly factor BamA
MTLKSVIDRQLRLLACLLALGSTPAVCSAADRVVEVRFYGNYSIPDDELTRAAGIEIGATLGDGGTDAIRQRLLRVKRVESVQIERRHLSLSDTGDIVLLISIKERTPVPKRFMVLPILSGSDEYGLEYGARFTAIDLLGAGERISFPMTWGGVRRAAVESRFDLPGPFADAFLAGASISQKEHPHYKLADRRGEFWGGLTRRVKFFDFDATGGRSAVSYGSLEQSFWSYGAGLAFDTRRDIAFPRDAVYARYGWERLAFGGLTGNVARHRLDLRGYKGLRGQTVFAAQFFLHGAGGRLPDYQRPFLGGAGTLRGHQPGEFAGDNLVVTSLELRLPISSALAVHRAGVTLFLDSGAVYDHGRSLGDAPFKHGAGVGFFVMIAGFGFKVDVAHDLHHRVRVHFATGFRF